MARRLGITNLSELELRHIHREDGGMSDLGNVRSVARSDRQVRTAYYDMDQNLFIGGALLTVDQGPI